MKIKKLIAAIAAAAIAVSTMAVTVFADGIYGGTWSEGVSTLAIAEQKDVPEWSELVCVNTEAVKAGNEDKNILVYVSGNPSEMYFKVAGNIDGNYDNGVEGTVESAWADNYNADEGVISVPYSIWSKYNSLLMLGGNGFTVYGIAVEGDTATIDAINALMGKTPAEDPVDDTAEAPADDAAEAPADDTAEAPADAPETTTAPETTAAPATGNVAVASIAAVMAVAGVAAIVSKKKN